MLLIGTKTGLDTPYLRTRSALPLLSFGSAPTPCWRHPAFVLLPISVVPPLPIGAAPSPHPLPFGAIPVSRRRHPRSPSALPLLLPFGATLLPVGAASLFPVGTTPLAPRSAPSLLPVGATPSPIRRCPSCSLSAPFFRSLLAPLFCSPSALPFVPPHAMDDAIIKGFSSLFFPARLPGLHPAASAHLRRLRPPPAASARLPPPPPASTASAASAHLHGLPPPPPTSTGSAASMASRRLRRLRPPPRAPPPPPTSTGSAASTASRCLPPPPPPPAASARLPGLHPAASTHLHGLRRLHGLPPPLPPPPASPASIPPPPPTSAASTASATSAHLRSLLTVERVSQIKDKVAAKEHHVADLQKRSQKLEDELSAARKVSSERQLVVTKLYKCFLQLQDYNDRAKISEKELQSLVDDAIAEVDMGEDAATKDGSMYENGVA
ncbi:hypothetical protein GUJ93_ZPchr0008g12988 [Zizania palustris]|uniref:Uncharacterized protein n=1 Tax=Zizania palustris TaxID=103762 RepID=A0A8J5RPC8_ZIZPA|nr:hypothetical protein GUJ93_ZPchr0008g12988 [Zizania palustris]